MVKSSKLPKSKWLKDGDENMSAGGRSKWLWEDQDAGGFGTGKSDWIMSSYNRLSTMPGGSDMVMLDRDTPLRQQRRRLETMDRWTQIYKKHSMSGKAQSHRGAAEAAKRPPGPSGSSQSFAIQRLRMNAFNRGVRAIRPYLRPIMRAAKWGYRAYRMFG